MKIGATEAMRAYARPDSGHRALLIWGADPMRVATRRQDLIALVAGPDADTEMRLSRMSGADVRRDPAVLPDAIKAQGFFPGPRVVHVEDATDGLAPLIETTLADWREGDALIVLTAGALAAKSALRKLFEGHRTAHALALYDDPPSREEIEAVLARAGLGGVDRARIGDLAALAQMLDPGDFRQTVEKLALYKLGDPAPLSAADIAACAPATVEAEVDEIIDAAASGRSQDIGGLMRRLDGQGVNAVQLCIGATRHFRQLQTAAADPAGAASGLSRVRPPVFGPRRDAMIRQVQNLGLPRIEEGLSMLVETDLALRSSTAAPAAAVMERTLIRLASLGKR